MGRSGPLIHGDPVDIRFIGQGACDPGPAAVNSVPDRDHIRGMIITAPRLPASPQGQLIRGRVVVEDDQKIDIAVRPRLAARPSAKQHDPPRVEVIHDPAQ
jgi:hypothetical protein